MKPHFDPAVTQSDIPSRDADETHHVVIEHRAFHSRCLDSDSVFKHLASCPETAAGTDQGSVSTLCRQPIFVSCAALLSARDTHRCREPTGSHLRPEASGSRVVALGRTRSSLIATKAKKSKRAPPKWDARAANGRARRGSRRRSCCNPSTPSRSCRLHCPGWRRRRR